jgi:hypothetical protein
MKPGIADIQFLGGVTKNQCWRTKRLQGAEVLNFKRVLFLKVRICWPYQILGSIKIWIRKNLKPWCKSVPCPFNTLRLMHTCSFWNQQPRLEKKSQSPAWHLIAGGYRNETSLGWNLLRSEL